MSLRVEKNSFGIYEARGTVEATFGAKTLRRRVRRSTGHRTLREAVRRADAIEAETTAELEAEYRNAKGIDDTPFQQAAVAYVKDGHEARFLEKLMVLLRDVPVNNIDHRVIKDIALKAYPDAAPATRRRQAETPIRAVINHHLGNRRAPREDVARTRWLTPEEAERLIDCCTPHARRMVLFLLSCGCRVGEMVSLDVEDIHADQAQAWIDASKVGSGKTGVSRSVLIATRGLAALLHGLPAGGHAFLTTRGKPYAVHENMGGQMKNAFDRARDKAGLGADVTPHVLRHTWATWFYAASNHNLIALEQLGGWRSPSMVRRYTKLAPGDLPDRLKNHGWDFEDVLAKVTAFSRPTNRNIVKVVANSDRPASNIVES